MKENNLIRLIQAFAISRIVYVAPYLKLYAKEKEQIESMIRTAYKQALGLPISTSNKKLLLLGVHNTINELIEAHTIEQYERLIQSATGRAILSKIGITHATQHGKKDEIPKETREQIHIARIRRNMHPEYNKERREDRTKPLHSKLRHSNDVIYVDAAQYTDGRHMTAVATHLKGNIQVIGTIRAIKAEIAEVTIALAITNTKAK